MQGVQRMVDASCFKFLILSIAYSYSYFPPLVEYQPCLTAAPKLEKNWSILMENCSRGEQLPLVDCLWSYGVDPLLCFKSDRLSDIG
jgi:hypothetical protein